MNHQSACVVSQAISIFAVCGENKYYERLKQSRNSLASAARARLRTAIVLRAYEIGIANKQSIRGLGFPKLNPYQELAVTCLSVFKLAVESHCVMV